MKKKDLFFPVILALLIVVAFQRILFTADPMGLGEAPAFWTYPLAVAREALVKNRRLPLWDDTVGAGYSFIGHPKGTFLYPVNWLFLTLKDPLSATRLSVVFHLFLSSLTFFYLVLTLRLNKVAAFFGATLYVFNSYSLLNVTNGFLAEIYTFAWLPLVCALLIKSLDQMSIKLAFLAGLVFSMEASRGLCLAFILLWRRPV